MTNVAVSFWFSASPLSFSFEKGEGYRVWPDSLLIGCAAGISAGCDVVSVVLCCKHLGCDVVSVALCCKHVGCDVVSVALCYRHIGLLSQFPACGIDVCV